MFGLVPFSGRRGLSQQSSANPFALLDAMRDSLFHDGFPTRRAQVYRRFSC